MEKVKISDFLIRKKDTIEITDNIKYKRLTIRGKNQGVCLRDEEDGVNIGTKKQFIAKVGQFILSKIDAMNGAFGIVPKEIDEAIITGNFWTFDINTQKVNIEWFNLYVSLPSFIKICDGLSSGTTHRKYLDEKKFSNFELFLPSIDEQKSMLTNFYNIKNLTDIMSEGIDTQLAYISCLRQSILQQAVEGKLCEQNPDDEPACVLLEKIKAEKEKLIEEKKIKKQKDLPPITEEENTFELPQGWKWCRLDDICSITDGTHQTPNYTEVGMPFLSAQNVKPFKFMPENFRCISQLDYENYVKTSKAEIGDVLMARVGAGIGEAAIVDVYMDFAIYVSLCLIKPFYRMLNMNYILNWINGPFGKSTTKLNTLGKGTSQGNLNLALIRNFCIPLPPLAEQQRIIEKVDNFMVLCDELEKEVQFAKKYASQLMETVLQEAFSTQKQVVKKNNVIEFVASIPKEEKHQWSTAARGSMKESTWKHIVDKANELANEES